jgi:hypothetical protein
MNDYNYRDLLIGMLTSLEPRFEKKDHQLVGELDEFGEVIFITKGKIGVGYCINKQKKFQIIYKNKCIIGAFGATFN